MHIKYIFRLTRSITTILLVVCNFSDRLYAIEPLVKKVPITPINYKINREPIYGLSYGYTDYFYVNYTLDIIRQTFSLDYGLVNFSLKSYCKGNIACFIKSIPRPIKTKYTRLGDLLYGMESGTPKDWRSIEKKILSKGQFKHTFAVKYMRSMGWLTTTSSKHERLGSDQLFYEHDWKQAKVILSEFKGRYEAAQDNEIVIYIRAGDKLKQKFNSTCTRISHIDSCNLILNTYADNVVAEATEIAKNNPGIDKITIVTAKRGSVTHEMARKELILFTDIIGKLSSITDNIWLHSSNDLDEDIFYMGTAKHLVAHKDIGNLSYVIKKIQAAEINE